MRPVDLPFSQLLGIRQAPAGASHLLELPLAPVRHNHLGMMHAAAQFALAEAASAEFLLRLYPELAATALAVVRSVDVLYRKAANDDLRAFARPDEGGIDVRAELARRGRTFVTVVVELRTPADVTSFVGKFRWYLSLPETAE